MFLKCVCCFFSVLKMCILFLNVLETVCTVREVYLIYVYCSYFRRLPLTKAPNSFKVARISSASLEAMKSSREEPVTMVTFNTGCSNSGLFSVFLHAAGRGDKIVMFTKSGARKLSYITRWFTVSALFQSFGVGVGYIGFWRGFHLELGWKRFFGSLLTL